MNWPQGHKVIVGVDSGELWDNKLLGWWNDFFHGDTPDHALVVAGIDMADPNNPMVILTDPGTGPRIPGISNGSVYGCVV